MTKKTFLAARIRRREGPHERTSDRIHAFGQAIVVPSKPALRPSHTASGGSGSREARAEIATGGEHDRTGSRADFGTVKKIEHACNQQPEGPAIVIVSDGSDATDFLRS